MENRFPLRGSRRPSSFVPNDSDYDEHYRNSRSEDSVRFADTGRPVQENVFATPPGSPGPSNVFATPVHSRTPSPVDLDRTDSNESTLAPSICSLRRDSSFSSRGSSSPIRVANGGYFPQHRVSSSLAPSIISNSSGHAAGLHRSNTVTTSITNSTNSSTLYSISQMSQFSSPPSPLPSIAPVRPRFDYDGHQQSIYPLSVHSTSDIGEHDPFADGYEITVGDGFAPHHQRPPPSIASAEPPPYSRYPDQPPLKPEERGVAVDVQLNPDPGVSIGEDAEDRRESRRVIIAPVEGINEGALIGGNGGGGGRGAPDDADDGSGAMKEWKEKRWLGIKARAVVLGLVIGLIVLLAVGLGVGLGMGLKRSSSTNPPVTSISVFPTTVPDMPPSSEETSPPISDPNDNFPDIKTGTAVLTPLVLTRASSSCLIMPRDRSSPSFFSILSSSLLWSCQYSPDKPLVWKFDPFPPKPSGVNMDTFLSYPDFLRGAEFLEGSWGGYMLSSLEGIMKFDDGGNTITSDGYGPVEYSDGPGWRDGAQNPLFWHMPLAFYNTSTPPTGSQRLKARSNDTSGMGRSANYKFGILYDKTVVLKQDSIDEMLRVLGSPDGPPSFANGTTLSVGETVWKCVWEKTLLEVEIDINRPSLADLPEAFGYHGDGNDDGGGDGSNFPDGRPPGPPSGVPQGGPKPQNSFDPSSDDQPNPSATLLIAPTPTSLNNSANVPADNADDSYKFSDVVTSNKVKRGEPTLPYPLKITIEESRPNPKRLRRVMAMDLTDPDPNGNAKPGDVKCTKMIVTNRGGLRESMDANGGGRVVLKEQAPPPRRKRDSPTRECSCRWTS